MWTPSGNDEVGRPVRIPRQFFAVEPASHSSEDIVDSVSSKVGVEPMSSGRYVSVLATFGPSASVIPRHRNMQKP